MGIVRAGLIKWTTQASVLGLQDPKAGGAWSSEAQYLGGDIQTEEEHQLLEQKPCPSKGSDPRPSQCLLCEPALGVGGLWLLTLSGSVTSGLCPRPLAGL
jgi:hypothetical protein